MEGSIDMSRKKLGLLLLVCMTMLLSCMQAGAETAAQPTKTEDEPWPGYNWLQDHYAKWDQLAKDYAPEIRTLKNGVKVQRTPSENQIYGWMAQSNSISYNTYYLDADHRGCEACHQDLNELLKNSNYEHPAFWNDALAPWTTVAQCLICHTYAPGYIAKQYDFGTMIHGIHYGTRTKKTFEALSGNCQTCHNMTADGKGTQLWDLVKYDKMVGIVEVPDVKGEFSITQDNVQAMHEVFSYDWMHSNYDNMRHAMGANGANVKPPQEMFDEWEISISGSVNQPFTMKLPDLIAAAEADQAVVTKISKMSCDWNAVGGGGISNTEITGIPLTWLMKKAGGVKPGVTGVVFDRGVDTGSFRCARANRFDDVYLVYKFGGDYLDGSRGYPVTNWFESVDAQSNVKQIAGYIFTEDDIDYESRTPNGWINEDGSYANKPNATILKVPEGMIVKTGEPYTFEGYADAYDEKIVSMEFSLDSGATWTKFDVGETDVSKWVYWYFTYTPETDGSYVMMVRATTENGLVSKTIHRVMFTAKSSMEE